jgi:putative exosortase-associated protein (TIGR04073 family)
MRKTFSLLGAVVVLGVLATGCAGPEKKLGRGLSNTFEIVRGGEFRRSIEQTAVFETPERSYTSGAVRGFNRSMARTGIGIYQVITFPIPRYDPIATRYLTPEPVYPDNFRPSRLDDSLFATDTGLGFSGGSIMPYIPGSRFRIFDN